MRKPASMWSLETLGRVRLSRHFYMRDFLHSEIGSFYGIPNIPENPDLAIENGRQLCEQLLDPLQRGCAGSLLLLDSAISLSHCED